MEYTPPERPYLQLTVKDVLPDIACTVRRSGPLAKMSNLYDAITQNLKCSRPEFHQT